MKKDLHYSNKLMILIIFLNGLIWGQKEFNVENLILNGDSYTKKFSEEVVNGSIFVMMGEIKVVMGRMRNGKKYDRWVYWWDNGLKQSEGLYDFGKKYGEWNYYNPQGIKDSIVNYKNNLRDGAYTTFYDNDQKEEFGNFKNGFKDGSWSKWWDNGDKGIEETYSHGDLIDKTFFDFEGNEIKDGISIHTIYGNIYIKLFYELAPLHVESFKLHAESGYYDGTIFHRVIPGFMIQGGDPNTKGENKTSYGTGGHAAKYFGIGNEDQPQTWSLPAEFNDISHERGILSMARSSDPNSGKSQFFICAADAPHLNGSYTPFGEVINGMNVVDQIINLSRDARDNPNERVEIKIELITSSPNYSIGLPIPGFEVEVEKPVLHTFLDSASYALGADLGSNLKQQAVELDYDVFMIGLTDAMMDGDLVKLDQKQRRSVMSTLQSEIRNKNKQEGEVNLKKADVFLAKNKADNSDIRETSTGLQYRVIRKGNGDSPVVVDKVKVHYVGRLIDGTVFDSSYERGEPTEFGLNQVIKGWTEGLQLMKVGAKYEFFIHPKIAYGSRPRPTIPSNSVLIFEVELLDIIK